MARARLALARAISARVIIESHVPHDRDLPMVSRPLIIATLIATITAAGCSSLPAAQASQNPLPSMGPSHAEANHSHADYIPFSSNGCSGFREARFFSCCYVHDLAYWAGGTFGDRRRADLGLRRCLVDVSGGDRILADFTYFLIRLGLVPAVVVDDGWGRAWRPVNRRRWAPLTPEQQRIVQDERRRACESLTLNPKTGRYRVDETREIWPNQARIVCGGELPGGGSARDNARSG